MTLHAHPSGSFTHPSDPGEYEAAPRISVTGEEAALLARLACGKHVLEIGTGLGISTKALASSATRLTTLDIDPWVHTTIFPTLRPLGITCCDTREEAAAGLPYDLIFIDGHHGSDEVLFDINYSLPLLCSSGLLVLHDYKMDSVRNASEAAGLKIYPLSTYWQLALGYKE